MQQYNHLVQTEKINPVKFQFIQEDCGLWTCSIEKPLFAECTGNKKQDAKRGVCEMVCEWYNETKELCEAEQEKEQQQRQEFEDLTYVLVDADSLGKTLSVLKPAKGLCVIAFTNGVVNLPESPFQVVVAPKIINDAADHLLTWTASRLVGENRKANFVIVSKDAALQTVSTLINLQTRIDEGLVYRAVYLPDVPDSNEEIWHFFYR